MTDRKNPAEEPHGRNTANPAGSPKTKQVARGWAAMTERIWQACPVCGGRGFVSAGFYSPGSQTVSLRSEKCRTCDGRTVIPVGQPFDALNGGGE